MSGKINILILEDSVEEADLLVRYLWRTDIEFELSLATDKQEYLEAMEKKSFDIVLSDHKLPQFSSIEALKIIRSKKIDVPFIIVTGAVSEEFAVNIMQEGADDYILKTNLQRLPSAIRNSIEKHRSRIERERAEENLRESKNQLRQLTAHLQSIREEERTTIAREVHDELGQQLTVLKMDLAWLNKRIVDPIMRERLAEMSSLIDQTVKSVRRIASELRPGILDDLGLIAALEWQSHEFEKRTGIACTFVSSIKEEHFEKSLTSGIFRVYQETLTNVARHSGAKKIKSSLAMSNGNVMLFIADNGKGFDEASIKSGNTLGIMGMKERAIMMGGMLKIESAIGEGTQVILAVPLEEKA